MTAIDRSRTNTRLEIMAEQLGVPVDEAEETRLRCPTLETELPPEHDERKDAQR